jgi:hypothetical protein
VARTKSAIGVAVPSPWINGHLVRFKALDGYYYCTEAHASAPYLTPRKTACTHCRTTKFGLIRQRHFRAVFCTIKCKTAYLARLALERQQRQAWLRWLNS